MLKRILRIMGAYLASCCVPHIPFFLWRDGLEAFPAALHPGAIPFVLAYALFVTWIPASIVITIGELTCIRRCWYYVGGGVLSSQLQVIVQPTYSTDLAFAVSLGGCLSGAVYWILAGRRAGPPASREDVKATIERG